MNTRTKTKPCDYGEASNIIWIGYRGEDMCNFPQDKNLLFILYLDVLQVLQYWNVQTFYIQHKILTQHLTFIVA